MATIDSRPTGGFIRGQDVNVSQTDPVHTLGQKYTDHLGTEWIYLRANSAITGQGYVCAVDASFDATLLTTTIANTYSLFYVVTGTNGAPADDDYFWGALSKPPGSTEFGPFCAAQCAADVQLYTTSTAGQLDDAAASQQPVDGVRLLTAIGTSGAAQGTASEWHYMRRGLVGT